MALGALIVKERLGTSDEETVEQIRENPYLQYFLGFKEYKDLIVVSELFRQRKWMHERHENRIDDRIVSICQPHIRPIKRGKANASTEFGVKISASLVDGWCFLDHLDWNNFNESGDLINQVETYKDRFCRCRLLCHGADYNQIKKGA